MTEPALQVAPVLTVTRNPDGWNVLANGETIAGPYFWRESAETVVEVWNDQVTTIELTKQKRFAIADALDLLASILLEEKDRPEMAEVVLRLSREVAPEMERV